MLQRSLLALVAFAFPLNLLECRAAQEGEPAGAAQETNESSDETLSWDTIEPELTIGDQAPDIDVEHWVQDGSGRFAKVTKLESGKVYVIEFWATWCGPCVASMPHLSELQQRYAERGVQVVSISDEDLDTVTSFLEREAPPRRTEPNEQEVQEEESEEQNETEPQPRTFAELTSNYCLTTDPDESVLQDYFRAAGCRGIPTAFIVGKDGKVEWIGHPMTMDEPLEQVVTDSWDRSAFQEKHLAQQKLQIASRAIYEKAATGDDKGAHELLDSLKSTAPEEVQSKLDELATAIDQLAFRYAVENDQARAAQMLPQQIEAMGGSPSAVLRVTMPILHRALGNNELSSELSEAAINAVKDALENEPDAEMEENLRIFLTRIYVTQGDFAAAIEQQEQLIENAPEESKARLQIHLESLKRLQNEQTAENEDTE